MAESDSQQAGAKWAGDLQDGTMQGLAALRMLLVTGVTQDSPEALRAAVNDAVSQLDDEIGNLRALIAEMRGQERPRRFAAQTSINPRSSA